MQTQKNKISFEKLGESYYKITHKSGLTLLLNPMPNYTGVYALFATKFGSVNRTFKTEADNEPFTVPDGTAHYLEHKMFEGEEEDAFVSYARTGASANAYTSFDRTAYLFSASKNIYESLEILLNFVTHPYFTEENIAKEQGIIGQEIKMYEDDPSWCVFINLLKALYWNNPVRVDIAGSVESIAEITPETLYRTYNTFYNMNNMVLSVAGNFEVDKVLELADKILPEYKDVKIENIVPSEPEDIYLKKIEKNFDVSSPMFEIGFKEKLENPKDLLKGQIMSEILLEMLFGESTDFYQRLYNDGTINSTFGTEVMASDSYFLNVLGGESEDPEKVYDEIVAEIEKAKIHGLDRELFEIVKKAAYGARVSKFNSVEAIATDLVSCHLANAGLYDILKITSEITFEDIEERLKNQLFEKRSSISVVNPL